MSPLHLHYVLNSGLTRVSWRKFADELSEIDPVFEQAVSGLDMLLQSSDAPEQDEDALKGLEVEDAPQNDVDMDHDEVLAQMEARLAKLSRVSLTTSN